MMTEIWILWNRNWSDTSEIMGAFLSKKQAKKAFEQYKIENGFRPIADPRFNSDDDDGIVEQGNLGWFYIERFEVTPDDNSEHPH
jgi:hypothetical protein